MKAKKKVAKKNAKKTSTKPKTMSSQFPLLALWAKEAARACGYSPSEAVSLGVGYAKVKKSAKVINMAAKRSALDTSTQKKDHVQFMGDILEVCYVEEDGKQSIRMCADGVPYDSRVYREEVRKKFPDDRSYTSVRRLFREVLAKLGKYVIDETSDPYHVYEAMRKTATTGGKINLSLVEKWCETQINPPRPKRRLPPDFTTKPPKRVKRRLS